MKISGSAGYALLAVGYIAQHKDQKTVLSESIAKEYDIPTEYLLKILQRLVRASVLRSKRGPRGGFSLGKSTEEITMLEVIEAVDGPMTDSLNLSDYAKEGGLSTKLEKMYEDGIAKVRQVFEEAKLSALVED